MRVSHEKRRATSPLMMVAIRLLSLAVEVVQRAGVPRPTAAGGEGELRLPADYKSWPRFPFVAGHDARQVHELYVHPASANVAEGQPFPDGPILVIERYAAEGCPDRKRQGSAPLRLTKRRCQHTFVLGRSRGWTEKVSDRTEDEKWFYAVYKPHGG
jgi:hypothetical protein